jgi:ATP-dependent RNA helicase RhlE
VGKHLERSGISAAVIHGNKSQGARVRALTDFKAGRVNVLVATDIAARGLDIVQLPLVVNYDLPMVPEDYIHRAGRTGRAGQTGRAVSLVSQADRDLLRRIQRLLPSPIEHVAVDGFAVSAPAHDLSATERRHHHSARPNRGFAGNRSGHRPHRTGGSGRRSSSSPRQLSRS